MRVMIVEDQTMIRSLLESYFRAEDGYRITASIPSAAAERKIAPIFVGFITFSSTAMRRALAQIASTVGSGGRRMAQSIPRVR